MTFSESVRKCFRNYANFNGRASRSEYWWFMLFILPITVVMGLLEVKFYSNQMLNPISIAYDLVFVMPTYSVTARRLHDVELSGWFQAPYGFILIVGYIAPSVLTEMPIKGLLAFLLVLCIFSFWMLFKTVTVGTRGLNPYGADPLEISRLT